MRIKPRKSEAIELLDQMIGEEESFGALLHAIRVSDECSQIDFARKLRISKQHLCDIEKKRKFVSPERAAKFAGILGYSERSFVVLALQDLVSQSGLKYQVELRAA